MSYVAPVAQWSEQPESGAALSLVRFGFTYAAGSASWSVVNPAGPYDGTPIDWTGTGQYELLRTSAPGVLAASGGDVAVLASGVEAYRVVRSGSDLVLTTDLTLLPAASIYISGSGDLILVPVGVAQLRAARLGTVAAMIY